MTRGDHLLIKRRGYYHHGIDLGNGHIIHFSAKPGESKVAAHIRQTTMTEFTCGKKAKLREYGTCFPPEEIVARAESILARNSGLRLVRAQLRTFRDLVCRRPAQQVAKCSQLRPNKS